jgi:hypothetical protein
VWNQRSIPRIEVDAEGLIENIENKMEDNQMGFRPNRSTIDNIFIVRQIYEKSHEHNIDLYNVFVDYTHAFDSVYRNKLIECLKKFDVPDKLIRLIALTLKHTRAKVIRPIVTYACETWVLKETTKNKLMVFERKVLRIMFGPTKKKEVTWRINTND